MECSLRAARQRTVASSRQSNCRYIDRRFCCGPRFPHIETDCGNGRGLRRKHLSIPDGLCVYGKSTRVNSCRKEFRKKVEPKQQAARPYGKGPLWIECGRI